MKSKKQMLETDILREIGWFAYTKYNFNKEAALTEVNLYNINGISYSLKNNELTIILGRPGMLIGKGGENIDKLCAYLTKCLKLSKPLIIKLKESSVKYWLTSFIL
jgi:ribosomal protein S3